MTTCPINPPVRKSPMCSPPPLIRQNRGNQLYQNVLDAYGKQAREGYSTASKYYDKLKEGYSTATKYYNKFSDDNYKLDLLEPWLYEPWVTCIDGKKLAISPCNPKYILCKNDNLSVVSCRKGEVFHEGQGICKNRLNVPGC